MSGWYIAWGLRIRSEIAIPGALAIPAGDQACDLDISIGAGRLVEPERCDGPYRVGRCGFECTIPDVARYLCLSDGTIIVDPAPGVAQDSLSAMLIATVIPAVLWTRGALVLHAAAAILPGTRRAVAAMGPSGSGKSSLLARVVAMGGTVVADDSICVRIKGDGIQISGLPGGYFDPLSSLDADRSFHRIEPHRCVDCAELGAILVLDSGTDRVGRLNAGAAVQALLVNRHRPRIARLLGIEALSFSALVQLARDVPVYHQPPW